MNTNGPGSPSFQRAGAPSESTHAFRRDTHGDRIPLRKCLGSHTNVSNPVVVFFQIGRYFIRRWLVVDDCGFTSDNHNVAAGRVAVEIESDDRMLSNIAQLLFIRLTIDQNGLAVPQKPDRAWLRRVVTTHSRQ